MKLKIFFTFFLFLLPLASAFDCSVTLNPTQCEDVDTLNLNQSEKETLYSLLLYDGHSKADHDFVKNYNGAIDVKSPPLGAIHKNSKYIKNAWLSFLYVTPSVIQDDKLLVRMGCSGRSEYNYQLVLPDDYHSPGYPSENAGDCKRIYSVDNEKSTLNYFHNGKFKGQGKESFLFITGEGAINAIAYITSSIKIKHYRWNTYCCSWDKGECEKYCHDCDYDRTTLEKDSVYMVDSIDVDIDQMTPRLNFTILNSYFNTMKGRISNSNTAGYSIDFGSSSIQKTIYFYDVMFSKYPYYFVTLRAKNQTNTILENAVINDNVFHVPESSECNLYAYNHFFERTHTCDLIKYKESVEGFDSNEVDINMFFLFKLFILMIVLYVIYKLLKYQFKKISLFIIFGLILIPTVYAAEDCGITNLGSCIPEKLYEFILLMINMPILPNLALIKILLTTDASIEVFYHLWSVVRYILSFFYVFFFLYVGYTFLTSSGNPIKRGHAKDMLRDVFIMMVLIQSSYYLYGLLLSLSSVMNNTLLGMVDPHFFLLTVDNLANIGLEFVFAFVYMLTLFFALILLAIRFMIVSFGVVLAPIGLFLYFIPPLKGYGRFIINMLGIFIFITFIDLLIILASSLLIQSTVFASIKILVMINCFLMVNYSLWLAIKFALKRSVNSDLKDDIGQAMKYVAMLA